jgi:hypothetical protein
MWSFNPLGFHIRYGFDLLLPRRIDLLRKMDCPMGTIRQLNPVLPTCPTTNDVWRQQGRTHRDGKSKPRISSLMSKPDSSRTLARPAHRLAALGGPTWLKLLARINDSQARSSAAGPLEASPTNT